MKKGPFAVNVRELAGRPGEMKEQDWTVVLDEKFGEGLMVVPQGTPVTVRARMESVHEGILVSAEIDAHATGVCGRCLDEFSEPLEVEFQELFTFSSDEDSEFEVHDDHVDLEPLIRDAVVLSLPFQPVCSPDCAGLDPETGERLTELPDPESARRTDPRWAALQALSLDKGTGTPVAEPKEER